MEKSHNEDEIRNTVDYILFAIGCEGMILLSREVLFSFYDKNYKSRFSDDRYPIYVYKKIDKYYWKGENGESSSRMDNLLRSYGTAARFLKLSLRSRP